MNRVLRAPFYLPPARRFFYRGELVFSVEPASAAEPELQLPFDGPAHSRWLLHQREKADALLELTYVSLHFIAARFAAVGRLRSVGHRFLRIQDAAIRDRRQTFYRLQRSSDAKIRRSRCDSTGSRVAGRTLAIVRQGATARRMR